MLEQNMKKKRSLTSMLAILVLLGLIIVLENISEWVPGVPAI